MAMSNQQFWNQRRIAGLQRNHVSLTGNEVARQVAPQNIRQRIHRQQPGVTNRHRLMAEGAAANAANLQRRRRMGVVRTNVPRSTLRLPVGSLRPRRGRRSTNTNQRLSPAKGGFGSSRPFAM